MHDHPNAHPHPDHLAAFGLGKLDDADAMAIAAHVETCETCRQTVEETPFDVFLKAVHAARPTAPALLPPDLAHHPRFRIVRELGRGGMGVVYLAEHRLMERQVAIKVLSKSLVENPATVERFQREVRAAAKLDHPNIVRAYDAERAGDLHLLVMEYVEGLSLAQVLQRRGPLPVADACAYIRQAALGLQHAFEKGMVHRDLKPENLMLVPEHGVVKVLDFGLARLASERQPGQGLTVENAVMGTPEYMAPEQAIDSRQADIRADIYSLGCTLYCLLAGRPPFAEPTAMGTILAHREQDAVLLHEARLDVPAELSAMVTRMMAKDPEKRYQAPREVSEVLAQFGKSAEESGSPATLSSLADLRVTALAPVGKKTECRRAGPNGRRRRAVGLGVAAGVLALGLVMGILLLVFGENVQYLSDMQELDVKVAEGPPGVRRFAKKGDLGFGEGDPRYAYGRITVNGKQSPNGLSMNPESNTYASVRYKLGKTAKTFLASVGLDDSAGGPGRPPGVGPIPTPLTFLVLGDDQVLWKSRPVDVTRMVQECKVDVTEVDVLELRVDCPGPGDNAYAVWLEPRIRLHRR